MCGFCGILTLVGMFCFVKRDFPSNEEQIAVMKSAISRETDPERMALAVSRLSVAKEHFASELSG